MGALSAVKIYVLCGISSISCAKVSGDAEMQDATSTRNMITGQRLAPRLGNVQEMPEFDCEDLPDMDFLRPLQF